MSQMKEQKKTPEKQLNKMETNNLLDAEFKTLVMRMLSELRENLNSVKKGPVRNEGYTNRNDNLQESTVE